MLIEFGVERSIPGVAVFLGTKCRPSEVGVLDDPSCRWKRFEESVLAFEILVN
jgi:hypothetical protein